VALPTPAPATRLEPTEVNILTSADPLPASVASFDRWRTGLAPRNLYTVSGNTWPVDCVTDPETLKDDLSEDLGGITEFVPFTIYTHHGCEGRVDVEAYRSEALAVLDQQTSFQIAKELWTGATSGNPSLQSTANDLTGFIGSVGIRDAAAILIAAFETYTKGAKATLHVPQGSLYELADALFITRQGNRLVTPNGHVVIAGPGYPSDYTCGPTGSDPITDGQCYLYVTGCVEVAAHTNVVLGSEENFGGAYARQNLVEFYAERMAIYRFPTVPVFALRANTAWYTPPT